MATAGRDAAHTMTRTPIQTAALVVGLVFLIVGVAGFIPGVTTSFEDLEFAGHDSNALLFGVFQVSILHNIVHLLFGLWGLVAARGFAASRAFLIGGGLIYAVLWIYGLVIDEESAANFVPFNTADDWLHFGLALGMIGLGTALSRPRAHDASRP